jgi:hypothetical protein
MILDDGSQDGVKTMRRLLALGIPVCLLLTAGCGGGSDPKVTMADLDKVLEIFEQTLKEKAPGGAAQAKADPKKPPAATGSGTQLQDVKNDPKTTAEFLNRFAKNLNNARIVEEPIGVQMLTTGAVEGFVDKDKNMRKGGAEEKTLFTIQIDTQRNRLVASQTVEGSTYQRDRPYHYRPGGFFMGYMLGNMMGRQNGYYSGARSGLRPKFNERMSPKGYHSSALSKARSTARARTGGRTGGTRTGGSRGFRGGK